MLGIKSPYTSSKNRNGGLTNHYTSYKTYKMGFLTHILTEPDGSLRICLDLHDLNKSIIREDYKAPTLEEISHWLSGAMVFSKMDTKDWFRSIHLDNPSSYLTTFNTHERRYRFLRIPFGLKVSQDVFQMRMENITGSLPDMISLHDDICIFGKTQQEHDAILLQLIKTATIISLVFNSSK